MNLIEYNVKDRIGYITLNRPEKRNALNPALVSELENSLEKAESDPDVKVIILKANGTTFCAGADLDYLQQLQKNTFEENIEDSRNLMMLFKKIYLLKKVVIAQVQGHAIAGGSGLVSVCDFSFSVPEANFGYTEVKIGFIPAIVLVFLVRKIGEGKARELLLSGNIISAEEAAKSNLINWIVGEEQLEEQVFTFAQKLCNYNSGSSMSSTKQLLADIHIKELEQHLEQAVLQNAEMRNHPDCKKGIDSFVKKK